MKETYAANATEPRTIRDWEAVKALSVKISTQRAGYSPPLFLGSHPQNRHCPVTRVAP